MLGEKLFKNHDWIITVLILLLLSIGSLVIFSTTYNTNITTEGAGTLPKQILFISLGLIIYFIISKIDLNWLRQPILVSTIYIITILLLLYLIFFGNVIASTQRWIEIGFINIQPSEVAKIAIIVVTAFIFALKKESLSKTDEINFKESDKLKDRFRQINPLLIKYIVSFITIVPILFLVFIQPALGNTIILLLIWGLMVLTPFPHQLELIILGFITLIFSAFLYKFISLSAIYNQFGISLNTNGWDLGLLVVFIMLIVLSIKVFKINLKLLLLSIVLAVSIFPILEFSWNNILQDYHKERINTYIEGPETDRYNSGYQVIQSQIALGSGQFQGRGFLQGSQSALRVLDFAHTDFIFASLGEQFGFIGNILVLIFYFIIVVRIVETAREADDNFYSLICMGVASMILLNVFINIGMNMGILPVTGVPLPFVSYGGTSVIVNMIGLGLVQAVRQNLKSIDISEKVLVLS